MATTKRTTKGRATVRRAAGRTAKTAKPTSTRKTARAAAKPRAKSTTARATKSPANSPARPKTKTSAQTAAARKLSRPSTSPRPAAESAEVVALRAKFQRERNGFEKRLTEAVQEIGILRHHELRAMQLERQLAERDAVIARLQAELAEIERRPAEPVYVHEVQQTLALVGSARAIEVEEPELDEFEDERVPDDVDLVGDDD